MFKDSAAARTRFRRIGGVYEGNFTPGACSLVREELPKHRPAAVEDTLAEVGVAYHVAHAQIFQRDTVVLLHEFGRQLVREVAALVGDVFVPALDCQQLLTSILAALFGAGKPTLSAPEFGLCFAVELRVFNSIAVAGGDEGANAYVDTDNAPRCGKRCCGSDFANDSDIPLTRLVDDAQCFGRAFHVPVPAHRDTSNARELKLSPDYLPAVAVFLQPEAVETVSVLKARIAGSFARLDAAKKRLKRLVAVGCGNLQDVTVYTLRLWKRRLVVLDLSKLFRFGHAALLKFVCPLALRHAHIVEAAGARQNAEQVAFL